MCYGLEYLEKNPEDFNKIVVINILLMGIGMIIGNIMTIYYMF